MYTSAYDVQMFYSKYNSTPQREIYSMMAEPPPISYDTRSVFYGFLCYVVVDTNVSGTYILRGIPPLELGTVDYFLKNNAIESNKFWV